MPRMNQLKNPDLSDWQPAQPSQDTQQNQSLPDDADVKRSPFFHAPMPNAATINDSLDRQFYGGSNMPVHRVLRGDDWK